MAEVANLDLLGTKVEKIFTSVAPEEKAAAEQEENNVEVTEGLAYQRRRNLAERVAKLKLRHAAI